MPLSLLQIYIWKKYVIAIHLVLLSKTVDGSWEVPSTRDFSKMIISISQKFGYEKLWSISVNQLNSVLGKTHETPQESQYAYSCKSPISLSVYSPLRLFTDSAKSIARVRKSSLEKPFFPLVNRIFIILWHVKNQILGEISVKLNITGPAHNISKVSSKVYLTCANRVLRKYVLKPRSIATCKCYWNFELKEVWYNKILSMKFL